MDLERERLLLRLVEEALDRPAEGREAWIATATDDLELAADVRRLVADEERAAELPELTVPPDLLEDPRAEVEPGTVIDGFEILGPLGAGGMGRVFEARQLEPDRRVALKTLRVGLDSEDARRRFRYEAEVLARLRHPRIAQVIAVGTFREAGLGGPRDVPYFAMEFVEDARDVLSFADAEGLDRGERLKLFLSICDAIQHGHDRGVLHRDLKPTNLLVDSDGRPKVIDFGIARPVDPTSDESGSTAPRTLTGAVYGTPASLSPEQLVGVADLDVRADVYSLGVVLYRLICGASPHDLEGESLAVAARRVVEQEPRRPRQFAPSLPRDLEAIMLQAVARERAARYASVGSLATDLRRFLASEPVAARQPTVLHQLSLLARRHRLAFVASSIAVVAVIGGSSAAAVFGVRSARDADLAREAGRELERVADAAVAAEAEARASAAAAERARSELADLSLELVLEFASPIANLKGATEVRHQLMSSGMGHLALLEDELLQEPDTAFALCRAYILIGDLLGSAATANVGDYAGRREAHGRALAVFDRLVVDWPDDSRLVPFEASVLMRMGRLALDGDDREAAADYYGRALDAAREREQHEAFDADLAEDLALALSNYGAFRGSEGDDAFALEAFLEAQSLRSHVARVRPESVRAREVLGHSTAQLGAALLRNNRLDESTAEYESAIQIFAELAADHSDLDVGPRGGAESRAAFIHVQLALNRPAEVERLVDEALAILAELSERDPADMSVVRSRGDLMYSLGRAHNLRVNNALDNGDDPMASLELAVEAFGVSRRHFERLADAGALLDRERGYFNVIDAQLAQLSELAATLEEAQ